MQIDQCQTATRYRFAPASLVRFCPSKRCWQLSGADRFALRERAEGQGLALEIELDRLHLDESLQSPIGGHRPASSMRLLAG